MNGMNLWMQRARHSALLGLVFLAAAPLDAAAAGDGGIDGARELGQAFAAAAKKASPAVVFIRVESTVQAKGLGNATPFNDPSELFNDEFFRRFFGDRLPRPQQPRQFHQVGQGSGFIVSPDGYILTNNHVVGAADKITVKLADGREFQAKTIGTDPHTDVAIIKIEASNLPVLPLGDSSALDVGMWVLAIGNPFGLSHTVTAGIVSAKGRSSVGLADYEDFIQTDAAINPGNSGGPLINLAGQAVGINTAIFSRSGGYMGIGFAIPINMAKAIREQLMKSGKVTRGYLGVYIQPMTPELAAHFGLGDRHGLLVADVSENAPAQKAGLQRGDVIVSLNGHQVEQVGSFRNQVALMHPGTVVQLGVLRKGEELKVEVTLAELPANAGAKTPLQLRPDIEKKLGLSVQDLTPELAQRFGYQGASGVIVSQVQPGSVAALAGIQPGTLIQEVNRKPVHSRSEFAKALADDHDGSYLFLLRQGQHSRYLALKVPR